MKLFRVAVCLFGVLSIFVVNVFPTFQLHTIINLETGVIESKTRFPVDFVSNFIFSAFLLIW